MPEEKERGNISRKKLLQKKEHQQQWLFKFVYLPLLVIIVMIIFLHFQIEDFFLRRLGVCTTAVIGNEVDYHKGSASTYKYEFSIDGEVYYGDSGIHERTNIGDTVSIVYLKLYPGINRSIDKWFNGDFECNSE